MFKIDLNSIKHVKEFVNIACSFTGDIILKSDRYVVDGKSIMGIFSLDLSKPIEVEITPVEKTDEFKDMVKEFLSE